MAHRSKRMKQVDLLVEPGKTAGKTYTLAEAVEVLKTCPSTKFDQSVNIALQIGIDPKKSDQQVRGTVSLPHGTGQQVVVIVIAKGEKAKEALEAGADMAGGDELLEKIKGGWTQFSSLITTPDMMREVGKLGKVLGPRGLMPTPKAGTVTNEIGKAVKEVKGGKIEFKADKTAGVNAVVGKLSFNASNLVENLQALLQAIAKAKPSSAKGSFFRSLFVSSTMGPGLKIDLQSIQATTV